jgi:hypothetical protein
MHFTLSPSHTHVEQARCFFDFIVVSRMLTWKVTEFETDHYDRLEL